MSDTHIDPDKLLDMIQELESRASGDFVISYTLVMRTTVRGAPDTDAYRIVHKGSLSEQLGLLRYATVRAEQRAGGNDQGEEG